MPTNAMEFRKFVARGSFIGGSDARIIMGNDEAALQRLWREKRGETEPEDLSGNLTRPAGVATEPLNRLWYERTPGKRSRMSSGGLRHPVSQLDGGDSRRDR